MANSGNTRHNIVKPTEVSSATLQKFHTKLDAWYQVSGRHHLPWRNTQDAYAIWVSEVMLQQTQVKTVLERFYMPFITQFPSITALAEASAETLMKAWEGLGYYSRARNLQKAAQHIILSSQALRGDPDWIAASPKAPRNDGVTMPDTYEALLALSGIGRNTAHAILAFAYHQPVAVMEANVKRVLCRIFALKSPSDELLWMLAQRLLNTKSPFHYNQAMMDLGAIICSKSQPDCVTCPANAICRGKGAPLEYPARKQKKVPPIRKRILLALYDDKMRFVVQVRSSEFLSGLYGFIELEQLPPHHNQWQHIGHITQSYSHFILNADIYCAPANTAQLKQFHNCFYTLADIAKLPLSRADSKMLKILSDYFSSSL